MAHVFTRPTREELSDFCAIEAYEFSDDLYYPKPIIVCLVQTLTKQSGVVHGLICPIVEEAISAVAMHLEDRAVEHFSHCLFANNVLIGAVCRDAARAIVTDVAQCLDGWWRGSRKLRGASTKAYPAEFRRVPVDTVLGKSPRWCRTVRSMHAGVLARRVASRKRQRDEEDEIWYSATLEAQQPDDDEPDPEDPAQSADCPGSMMY